MQVEGPKSFCNGRKTHVPDYAHYAGPSSEGLYRHTRPDSSPLSEICPVRGHMGEGHASRT